MKQGNHEAMKPLQILFQDDHYIAIHKPAGLLVHRTKIAEEKKLFALQLLRNQIQQRVYTIHRIDRPTSGVLLFGLHKEAATKLAIEFQERRVQKQYLAIVRGFTEKKATINYDLNTHRGEAQEAITHYQTLQTTEQPIPVSRYQTARYAVAQIQPVTGRQHQIRRHFAHIRHPIIGDKRHGDVKHNKMFKERFDCTQLMLLAQEVQFMHPYTQEQVTIEAKPSKEMLFFLEEWEWNFFFPPTF